jgi:hypothetical protein
MKKFIVDCEVEEISILVEAETTEEAVNEVSSICLTTNYKGKEYEACVMPWRVCDEEGYEIEELGKV